MVRITPARYGGTIGGLLRTPESDRQRIVDAAIDTQQMIDKRFARGASHVVLDEIRGDTSLVAQELFKRLPPSERGKLAAFVVGGAGVNYHHNPTLDAVWHGMARNRVAALPETYGGANLKPGAQMLAAAKDALDKVKFLRSKGIVASPAVSPLDQYHGVGEAGNRHAVQWVNTLRGVMPNTPLSEWAIGGTKNQPLPGRRMLAAILRDRTP